MQTKKIWKLVKYKILYDILGEKCITDRRDHDQLTTHGEDREYILVTMINKIP